MISDEEFVQLMREMFSNAYRGNSGEPWAPMGFLMNRESKENGTLRLPHNGTDVEIKKIVEDKVERHGFDAYAVGLEFIQIGSRAEDEAIKRGADNLGSLSNLGAVSGIVDPRSVLQGADRLFAVFIGTATGAREVVTFAVNVRKGKAYLGNEQKSEGLESEILGVFPKPAGPRPR